MSEEFLTVTEASEKLSVSPRTIQRYCRQGRLNHKWIQGKRHKELRIIPPIEYTDLPGVKHRTGIDASDLVSRADFERSFNDLRGQIAEKDRRIRELEDELAKMRRSHAATDTGSLAEFSRKADMILYDVEQVRPKEKRLILKLAREVSAHAEFLKKLGMGDKPIETD